MAPLAPGRCRGDGLLRLQLSPINRRRLDNFSRNRRGYWSFWIFLVLFVLSLFAEFIANDRPFSPSTRANFCCRSSSIIRKRNSAASSPRPTIATRYRPGDRGAWLDDLAADPFLLCTINLDLPTPVPSPPTWMLTEAQCHAALVAERACRRRAMPPGGGSCRDLEWNWLGTDARAATSSRASSTAFASRSCSA